MKSRRDTGPLWLSCLMGSSRPRVRGLFLRIYMLYSLLNERRAAAEHSAASRFHDRSTARRARTRGAGNQAIDQARSHIPRAWIRHAVLQFVADRRSAHLVGLAGANRL